MLAMCHVHQPTLSGTDGILYLAAVVALPLNKVAGGNQATPLPHAVSEQCPTRGGFAVGVNDSLAVGQQVAPAHGERVWAHTAAVGNDRNCVCLKIFARLERLATALQDSHDFLPTFFLLLASDKIFAAHFL